MKLQLSTLWSAAKPLFIGNPNRKAKRSWIVATYTLSGILLGLALFDPRCAVCAWLSIATMTVAISWTEAKLAVFLGPLVAQFLAFHIGLEWASGLNEVTFGFSPSMSWLFALAQSMTWSIPFGITILVGHVLFRKRLAPCWWLPIAWGAGESLRFAIMTVNLGDWLATQWTTEPVLRMLGRIGWWPTHYLCLFAAACIGQALVTRRRWVMLPSVPIAAVLVLLPPLSNPGTDLFRGIAAVHATSGVSLPHVPPPETSPDDNVELIIWPEQHFHLRPMLVEGKPRGVYLPRPLYEGEAEHLLGVETTFPTVGPQNQVAALGHDGLVLGSRAKKLLFLFTERRLFGMGRSFVPGNAPTLLKVAGRSVISLICGEFLSRALVAEGREAGGELLAVLARDDMMVNDRAKRQLLAVQVMRSVEYGIPSVRASYRGWAYFISADGKVLARSGTERDGMLRWDAQHGARDHDFWGDEIDKPIPPRPAPDIAVLYAKDNPQFQTRCPEGTCTYHAFEDFECAQVSRISTVIVAGHAAPPEYLSGSVTQLAEAIRCFSPELVVVDTCFGASSELLKELSDLKAMIVAPSVIIPTAGLEYLPAFFSSRDPGERARSIVDPPGNALLRWRIDRDELSAAIASVDAMDGSTLAASLRRRMPPYVGIDLAGAGDLLVPVKQERLQGVAFPHRNRALPRVHARNANGAPNISP